MSAAATTARSPGPRAHPAGLAARVAGFAILYFLLCRLGDELHAPGADFAIFWPASGAFLTALLAAPAAAWPWLALGVVAAELAAGALFDRAVALSLCYALADVLEAGAGAFAVRRLLGPAPGAPRGLGPLARVLAPAFLAAGAGAAIGAVAFRLLGASHGDEPLPYTWLRWWICDAVGILVVAPAALAWQGRPPGRWRDWLRLAPEAVLVSAVTLVTALVTFGPGGQVHLEWGYLLVPALGWAAYRFGLRGASAFAVALATLSAWSVSRAPEGAAAAAGALTTLQVQLLLAVSVSAALLLAAAMEERESSDAARRESEALFDAFLAHSPAALFILDARARLVGASRSFERMMGRPAAELAGARAEEALPGEEGRAAMAEDAAILAGRAQVRVDRTIAGRIQDIVKFRIARAGRPPLIGGVAVDVTEQRLALRSLRLAQVALDRNFTALLFVEPSGLVTYANEAAGRLLGRPAAELVGRSAWELGAAPGEAAWPAAWARLREQGSLLLEGRLGPPGGPGVEAELGLAFVAYDGQEYAVLAARDLTERRRAEAAQRLAAVGTLAAGMAHEVNNPLTYVAANLAYALDRLAGLRGEPKADEALRALEDAEEGTRRVARVVRDLKAVSRVEPEARRPVDVRAEVETALNLAQHELRHRATLELALGPLPPVDAAEFQLGQVFLNLLVNAAQAVGDGGPAAHHVRVATRTAPDGWAVVEIADSGAGIAPETRPRIFEPFFTTKPLGQGTGLGLSVCHGIVTGLGGRIEVESEPGRGATFRVLLPPARPAAAPPPAAPRARPDGPRGRILVVDDEPLVGSTIRRLLSAHEVVALTDPRDALARLLGGERFDLVLCDLMMPQLSGMELHEAVVAARPEVARRMVFMTGGAFTDRSREFLERVGSPQLAKPFAPQDLRELVRAWLAAAHAEAGAAPTG